jgi:two-component system sensor histidine kinase/response regulator
MKWDKTMQRQGKILAVDDDANNIAILKELLQDDYDLETTTRGEHALEIARTFRPDVILLDIMMPGMDGYEVCRRLREQGDLKYTKIIMVSARAMVPERLEGYKAGADDYITKPFDGDEFLAKIHVYLRLKRAEEQNHIRHEITVSAIDALRTPAAAASDIISNVSEKVRGKINPNLHRQLEKARDCMDHFGKAINNFLDLSEVHAGEAQLQPTPFPMQSVVSEAVESLKPKTALRKINVSIDMPAEELQVMVDRRKIARVLGNLIDSAISLPYEGNGICVRVRDLQDRIGVAVEDNNPGIDADEIDGLLNRSAHGEDCAGPDPPNPGLALAVAKAFVELHGGRLWAESRPEGGIVYSFEIPLCAEASDATQPALSTVGNDERYQ